MSEESKDIQSMVAMLKQGATLTEFACPACSSPLFRVRSGDLRCAKCDKQVIIVKEGEDAETVASRASLMALQNTIIAKIQAIEKRIRNEENAEKLQQLSTTLASLLENLDRLKKMGQA
ncbi:MAG: hypothetical protein JSV64_08020 [Candidatus Bathyarchaeota archaeon]|nr:MAG: hypothetical protein JSV64_08020 [Candidatus Bathyarchaeota archaeon]